MSAAKHPDHEFDYSKQVKKLLDGDGNPMVVNFVRNIPKQHLPPTDPNSPQARILEAARTLFAEKSFEGASTREIALAADVNQAMIHYYFGNKQQLYKRVIIDQLYTLFIMISSMMQEDTRPVGFVSEFPLRLIEQLRKRPMFRKIILREIADGGMMLREIIEELGEQGPRGLRQLMFKVIGSGIEQGEIRDLPLDSVMLYLLGVSYSSMFVETFFSIVAGIDFNDPEQWQVHRKSMKTILQQGLMRTES
ncbi:TetR/AcrR family transcriptional regulator [bacterium]|nr:TetR/AcrR family transcriptional regulator [bacterium]